MNPLLLGLFLTGASAVTNTVAQNQAAAARQAAIDAERQRQMKFDREADAKNTAARERYEDFEGQQDEKSTELADMFAEAPKSGAEASGEANVSAADVMPSAGTNDIVLAEMDKQKGLADAFTGQQADARGKLRSFGDVLGGISLEQSRTAQDINALNGFRSGSASVLPYELEAANQEGAGARMLGDILGLAGSVVTPMGINAAAQAGNLPGWLTGASWAKGGASLAPKTSPRPVSRPGGV